MRYLFLLLQFFFFSLAFESSEARLDKTYDSEYDFEDDDDNRTLVDEDDNEALADEDIAKRNQEEAKNRQLLEAYNRHFRNYLITLYSLLKLLGSDSYIANEIKIKIDDFIGSNFELLRALKAINERKDYPSLYLRSGNDDDDNLTGNLFEEDNGAETNLENKPNLEDNRAETNLENKPNLSEGDGTLENESETSPESPEENSGDGSEIKDESEENSENVTDTNSETTEEPQPITPAATINQSMSPAQEISADQGSEEQSEPDQGETSDDDSSQELKTEINTEMNDEISTDIILQGNDSAQNQDITNNETIYNGTVNQNQTYNNGSEGTSWGGILGGVAGGAALGVLGTTLYNSWNNQNEYGVINDTNNLRENQRLKRNSVVSEQDSLPFVDLSDDRIMPDNPQNSNQYDQVGSFNQGSLSQPNLSEEDSVENNDDSDQNSENNQDEELENEENLEKEITENNSIDEQTEDTEDVIDNIPTDIHQQPMQMMEQQIPYNADLMPQLGVQMPYNINIPQQFGMQTPYNTDSLQQFGMQSPYNIGSVPQPEMQIPYSSGYSQPSSQKITPSILDNLVDQEKTVIGNNYSTLSQKQQNSLSRSAINQENRVIRKVIKNKNGDIYIKSKKNTGSQQPKMSIIPVRQVKENEPLEMIQDLADNKIHAHHF